MSSGIKGPVIKLADVSAISEEDIEQKLVRIVKAMGGLCYKFSSPGHRAVPDRLCIFTVKVRDKCTPVHFYVECKAPKKSLTTAQAKECLKLSNFGCFVYVVKSYDDIISFIERVKQILSELAKL